MGAGSRGRNSGSKQVNSVYAVVLAAGRGERFGGMKLLAPWRGRPLLWHTLASVRTAVDDGLLAGGCVVVPTDVPALSVLAEEAGLTPLPNPAPAAGLSSSVRLAFDWLARQPQHRPAAALVLLGDQPAVPAELFARLIAEWRRGEGMVIRPRYAAAPAEPGHPTLVDQSLWKLADELTGDAGLGPAFSARHILIVTIDAPGHNPDVDTRSDLMTLGGTEP